jgi:hypothetical protein
MAAVTHHARSAIGLVIGIPLALAASCRHLRWPIGERPRIKHTIDTCALLHRYDTLLHNERLGAIRGIDACGIRSQKSCSNSTKDLC